MNHLPISVQQVGKPCHLEEFQSELLAMLGDLRAAKVVVLVFSAEISPKEIRGKLGAYFELFFATGVMVAYFLGDLRNTERPAICHTAVADLLQLLPASILLFGMFTIKEGACWLAKKVRIEEARESLK
jgi:hypothetical protein